MSAPKVATKNAIGKGTSIGWMGWPAIFAVLRGLGDLVLSSVSRLVRISIFLVPISVVGNVARAVLFRAPPRFAEGCHRFALELREIACIIRQSALTGLSLGES